jgi:hypothetical protein
MSEPGHNLASSEPITVQGHQISGYRAIANQIQLMRFYHTNLDLLDQAHKPQPGELALLQKLDWYQLKLLPARN